MSECLICELIPYCDDSQLRSLSVTSSDVSRYVLNAVLVLFQDIFLVRLDDASIYFPRSRDSLLRLIHYARNMQNPRLTRAVLEYCCGMCTICRIDTPSQRPDIRTS